MKAGKYQEAVIQFRNAARIDPRFAAAHYELARAYQALNQNEPAWREFTETVALDPGNRDAQLRLAALMFARRQYAEGQSIVQRVLHAHPEDARAHALLAERYTITGDTDNAISELRKVIELDRRQVAAYIGLGAAFASAGRNSEAEAAYREAVGANPKSAAARLALGRYYVSAGRMAEAESEIRAGCDLEPRAAEPRLLLARIFVMAGKLQDAEALYQNLKQIAPADARARHALAAVYVSRGEKDKAVAELRSLLSVEPGDDSARANLIELLLDSNCLKEASALLPGDYQNQPGLLIAAGRVFAAKGQLDLAEAAFEKAIKADPKSARAYHFLGMAQRAQGLEVLARSSFAHALELSPGMPEPTAALADLDVRGGRNSEASHLAENAMRANPNSFDAYVVRARAFLAQGNISRARAALQAGLVTAPDSLPILAELMNVSIMQGDARAVMQRVSGLIQLRPEIAGLHFLLAIGYFSEHDLPNAERAVRQAIALNAKTPGVYALLAEIDSAKGSSEQAIADLEREIANHPDRISNYMALVTAYEKNGKWQEAKRWCEKAHQTDPDAPLVAAELAFLYLEHGGDANVALTLAQTAKQKLPESAVTSDALGWAYYKTGLANLAVAQLRNSVLKSPDNPVYQYHIGMAYMAASKFDLARHALQDALRKDPKFPYALETRNALSGLTMR